MGRLFGTDGIRGVANVELTPELAFKVGRAASHVLSRDGGAFVIGRDTRISGEMLEAALVASICSTGGAVLRAGVIPTPGAAYLGRTHGAVAVAISASHNPVADNGIKFFARDGFKLPDTVEDAIEAALDRGDLRRPTGAEVGRAETLAEAVESYADFVASLATVPPSGLRVVVDCAYGAAYAAAPLVWERLGATVIPINAEADGRRINVDCGSTSPEVVRRAVLEHGADLGFAHDGDADRVIAVDETGRIVDGDAIMGLCALHLAGTGRLPGMAVVATVMSNLGLEVALRRAGIALERTKVGDRYVLERMREVGVPLGGEQSGHVIFLDHVTTGDGLVTAVQVANVMMESGRRLSELAAPIQRFPQVLKNVRVAARDGVGAHPAVQAAVGEAERRLGARGRVLVRPSGTEPVVRVMVEAEDGDEAEALAAHLAEVIGQAVGQR
ncbi:MAG TPA: phosphoglucosamine mutase [bacterium]|nr:phosphoglucosamine mutase [bacterium]